MGPGDDWFQHYYAKNIYFFIFSDCLDGGDEINCGDR